MRNCPACGATRDAEARFCSSCGTELTYESDTTSEGAEWEADVLTLASRGKKIEAIKLYREATGVGLKEAKEAVEALMSEQGIDSPGSGCASVLLAVFLLLGLGWGWAWQVC